MFILSPFHNTTHHTRTHASVTNWDSPVSTQLRHPKFLFGFLGWCWFVFQLLGFQSWKPEFQFDFWFQVRMTEDLFFMDIDFWLISVYLIFGIVWNSGYGYYPYPDNIRRIRIRIFLFWNLRIRIRIRIRILVGGFGYGYGQIRIRLTALVRG